MGDIKGEMCIRDSYSAGMEWASQGDVADKMQISDEDGIRVLREIGAQGIETASRQRKHLNGGQDWMSETDLDSCLLYTSRCV